MGREFELKFGASKKVLQGLAALYPEHHVIKMETTYYDTPEGDLNKLRWTLRCRLENGVSVCTLKTPGQGFGHGEWELPGDSIEKAIPALCTQGAPAELASVTAKGLTPVCGARFTRTAILVRTGMSLVELALDEGVLLGGGREEVLSEVEVELKEGRDEDAVTFGQSIARDFSLSPETRSKYARAMALTKGE